MIVFLERDILQSCIVVFDTQQSLTDVDLPRSAANPNASLRLSQNRYPLHGMPSLRSCSEHTAQWKRT